MNPESAIRRDLLRYWPATMKALDALTDSRLSTHESILRFSRITKRWLVEHQALALSIGGELRVKGIRVGGTA